MIAPINPKSAPNARTDVELLLQLSDALVDTGMEFGLALLAHYPPRFARCGVSGLLGGLELAHDLIDRPAGHLAAQRDRTYRPDRFRSVRTSF
jgi:hypothetical protein